MRDKIFVSVSFCTHVLLIETGVNGARHGTGVMGCIHAMLHQDGICIIIGMDSLMYQHCNINIFFLL